jgi:hypothetical protein
MVVSPGWRSSDADYGVKSGRRARRGDPTPCRPTWAEDRQIRGADPSVRIGWKLYREAKGIQEVAIQRRLNAVIAALPEVRRRRVETRAQALMSQVEGLGGAGVRGDLHASGYTDIGKGPAQVMSGCHPSGGT